MQISGYHQKTDDAALQLKRAADVSQQLVEMADLISTTRDLLEARDKADAKLDVHTEMLQRQVASIAVLLRRAQQRASPIQETLTAAFETRLHSIEQTLRRGMQQYRINAARLTALSERSKQLQVGAAIRARQAQEQAQNSAMELDAERVRSTERELTAQALRHESLQLQRCIEGLRQEHAACGPAITAREAEVQRLTEAVAGMEEKLGRTTAAREEEGVALRAQVEAERRRYEALRQEHLDHLSVHSRLSCLHKEADRQLTEACTRIHKLELQLGSAARAAPVGAQIQLPKWQLDIVDGPGGTIRARIQRASGAQIEIKGREADGVVGLEIRGSPQQCRLSFCSSSERHACVCPNRWWCQLESLLVIQVDVWV